MCVCVCVCVCACVRVKTIQNSTVNSVKAILMLLVGWPDCKIYL